MACIQKEQGKDGRSRVKIRRRVIITLNEIIGEGFTVEVTSGQRNEGGQGRVGASKGKNVSGRRNCKGKVSEGENARSAEAP